MQLSKLYLPCTVHSLTKQCREPMFGKNWQLVYCKSVKFVLKKDWILKMKDS